MLVRFSTPEIDQRFVESIHDDRLGEFVKNVFSALPRSDQRRWAEIYTRGLLLGTGPKSIRRTAQELVAEPAIQSLQQFVNQSPWDWQPIRERLAAEVQARLSPEAWVVVANITSKRGDKSIGVERRFVPSEGRLINCQMGLGLMATSRLHGVPIDWRLVLSPRWTDDPARRAKARIPDGVHARAEWEEVLDMVRQVRDRWGMPVAPLLGEWRTPGAVELVNSLVALDQPFALEVDGSLLVAPAHRPLAPAGQRDAWQMAPRPLAQHARIWEKSHRHIIVATGQSSARVVSMPITMAPTASRFGAAVDVRLIAAHPTGSEPPRYWVTNLFDAPLQEIIFLLQLRETADRASDRLYTEFGVSDFEGRSFLGWHHHATLVSTACAYDCLYR
ncbi:transposase [Actinoplanes oblitus]|uniref:Transposase n=1 Tax=Actinoplanes oblitus TaxID=3040509 RepID=A0ABY8W4T8_9ACTN|nr:transposase [Actinoplanes oblitus]WIM92830.1 transposase [Actinoplanes oblitus]